MSSHEQWVSAITSTANLSEEVKQRREWMVIRGHICDVSSFLAEHPGGNEILEEVLATDATEHFEAVVHSDAAFEKVKDLSVGKCDISIQKREEDTKPPQKQSGWFSSVSSYFFE